MPFSTRLRAVAFALAQRLDDPYALGLVHLASGMAELCVGRWPSACVLLRQAIAVFQERCRGVSWERSTAELFLLRCLLMMGEFAEAERLSVPMLKDARERGDVYSAIMNGAYVGANVYLAADDVAAARDLVRELVGEWPSQEFNIQHLHALWGVTCIDLYCEEGTAAWDRLNRVWPLTRGPQNVQLIHIWMLAFRAAARWLPHTRPWLGTGGCCWAQRRQTPAGSKGRGPTLPSRWRNFSAPALRRAGGTRPRRDNGSFGPSRAWTRWPCTPTPPLHDGASARC